MHVDNVLVCEGKHCRRAHDDAERARRSLEGAAREGGARLVVVDCLGCCDDAPVAVIGDGVEPIFLGNLARDKHTLALCDVIAGRAHALHGRLEKRRIVPSGKARKRAARALG